MRPKASLDAADLSSTPEPTGFGRVAAILRTRRKYMSKPAYLAAFLVTAPLTAFAQNRMDSPPPPPPANPDAAVGGAVGGVVGGAVDAAGAIVGGIVGEARPRFHHYAVEERRAPSYRWAGHGRVVVGDVLPPDVVYYVVPREYGVTEYRYTVVDNDPVLVDQRSRRVVEVFD